jgi:hypothetical protein
MNPRRTGLILELVPKMPIIFPTFFHRRTEPVVPRTDSTALKYGVPTVKRPSSDLDRTEIPTTKLTSLKLRIKASDIPQWL